MQAPLNRRHVLAGIAAAPWMALPAFGQSDWPTRDLKIVAPVPAGGGVDIFARGLAEQLTSSLGKPVIVDNKPGAGGLIGVKAVAAAAPDGYTVAYVHSGIVTVQAMTGRLDMLKELRMVARLSYSPFAMVVRAESPYKTAQELIAAVQASPGKLTYGSGGIGSPANLVVEHMEDKLGNFKALHVPYKGAGETANALVGGQVDFSVSLLGALVPLVQGGKLRLLAVTSASRVPLFPNVPTLAESGFAGFAFEPWGGLAVPAGTPDAVVQRLAKASQSALDSAALKEVMQRQGSIGQYVDGAAFTVQLVRDIPVEQALVKRLGMTGQ
jgi:tripartite-type tricarboxylate transporter receptor subunit TctC